MNQISPRDGQELAEDRAEIAPGSLLNKIHVGDCVDVMKRIPDGSISIIITDPVWPNAKVPLHGSDDPFEALRRCASDWPRLTESAIVHLGCDSDPRFLSAVPKQLEFLRVAWMRYARPHYKGRILFGSDVAYVFGKPRMPAQNHVLPGECVATLSRYDKNGHPCPRRQEHLDWLVSRFTREGDTVLDPFCGSGTTLIAAEKAGRNWIGIESNPDFAAIAQARIEQERAQLKMAI